MERGGYAFVILIALTAITAAAYFTFGRQTSCDERYDEIEKEIDNANYCETNNDCEVLILGGDYMEFGCYHFINKEVSKQNFYDRMEKYKEAECSRMIDKCIPAPEPDCVSGKCVYIEGT